MTKVFKLLTCFTSYVTTYRTHYTINNEFLEMFPTNFLIICVMYTDCMSLLNVTLPEQRKWHSKSS